MQFPFLQMKELRLRAGTMGPLQDRRGTRTEPRLGAGPSHPRTWTRGYDLLD